MVSLFLTALQLGENHAHGRAVGENSISCAAGACLSDSTVEGGFMSFCTLDGIIDATLMEAMDEH